MLSSERKREGEIERENELETRNGERSNSTIPSINRLASRKNTAYCIPKYLGRSEESSKARLAHTCVNTDRRCEPSWKDAAAAVQVVRRTKADTNRKLESKIPIGEMLLELGMGVVREIGKEQRHNLKYLTG